MPRVARTRIVATRLTPDEYKRVDSAAARDNARLSEWVRTVLLRLTHRKKEGK